MSAAWDQFERRYNAQRGFSDFGGSGASPERVREYQTGSGDEPTGTIFDDIENIGSDFIDLESEGNEGKNSPHHKTYDFLNNKEFLLMF